MRSPHLSLASSLLMLVLSLAAAGCETSRSGAEPARDMTSAIQTAQVVKTPTVEPATKKLFGEPLSSSSEKVALGELLKSPTKFTDRPIQIEGKVTAVCQNKGCWLELEDEHGMAHVKLGAHKFFVPKTASGQHAVVEGKVFAQVEKGHCEQEAEEQTGKVAKVELDATGVELSAMQ